MSKKLVIAILVAAVAWQTFFSFLSPVYDPSDSCQHSSDYFLGSDAARMKDVIGVKSADFGLAQKFFSWFPNYHLICDATTFLFLAKDWPNTYKERNLYIDHPLYNFFVYLVLKPASLMVDVHKYAIIFAAFIGVNFLMMAAAAVLFYLLLLDFISPRNAFVAGLLFVFSPFVHAMINQTTSSGIIEIFVVATSLWLLNDYRKHPGTKRLIIYSILFGLLLLGKQIFALSLFALFLAWYFKRKKEGLMFLVIQFIPTVLWFLYVKFGLQLPYYLVNVSAYDQGTWFLKVANWQPYQMGRILLSALPKFITTTLYGFILVPVIFSVYGLYKMDLSKKYLLYFSFLASFFLLFFGMNYFRDTLSFLMFPIIYSTAAVGVASLADYLKKYSPRFSSVVYYGAIIFIIAISSVNVYLLAVS